ncbi:MAG: hypothetical protein QGG36_10745 [Pirellulaceae bacterium]|jgi:hypothetical protein|nr:hypothetical protein [Pirellulaceae bacterium]MDP7016270.1 hypothetical protein [Pirellulaceae bacterium]
MKRLRNLERKLEPYAVRNVTIALICGQVVAYVASAVSGNTNAARLALGLDPARVFDGEVWRVVTYLFVPPVTNIIFAFFFWYLFFIMGNALENTWGVLRYNLYLLIGYLAITGLVLGGGALLPASGQFFVPEISSNAFVKLSVLLAFAYLYPEFRLLLFLVFPVPIKWIALITWLGLAFGLIFSPWIIKLGTIASVLNFGVFFGKDIYLRIRSRGKRMQQKAADAARARTPRHVCTTCGVNDLTHPDAEFRYCSKCDGAPAFCLEHLHNHEHVGDKTE